MNAPASVLGGDSTQAFDLAVAGNLLVDDVVLRDGRTRMGEAGGAVLYVSLGARLWGARVGVASVAGDDYPAGTLTSLVECGVDLSGVRRLARPGLRTWLLDEAGRRRVVHHLDRPSHAAVSPGWAEFPDGLRRARMIHVAPMPLDSQRDILETAADAGAIVSVDPHEPIDAASLAAWRAALAHADLLFASEEELRLPDATEPRALAERLGGGRLRWVAIKRGDAGGVLCDLAEKCRWEWAPRAEAVEDPTGAGDAFAAGFLSAWGEHEREGAATDERVTHALQRGVVSASFAIAAWGAGGLWRATPAEAEARRRAWFGGAVAKATS